jgi:hypothetical protein
MISTNVMLHSAEIARVGGRVRSVVRAGRGAALRREPQANRSERSHEVTGQ